MKRLLLLIVLCLGSIQAFAATCPFNIQVVSLPPHQMAGFSWGNPIRPMNDACVSHIAVENTNQNAWYVGGFNGVYMTKNNGGLWTKPVAGKVGAMLWVPANQLLYVGVGPKLYLTRDHGANWTVIHTFAKTVTSLLVANNTLYVGLAWNNHIEPSGVFTSNLGGGFMTFHAFGPGHTGLIVWTLSRSPVNGTLYAGTEIFDHQPLPYKPPFFRSINNAGSWTNVQNNLPWHAIDSAVRLNGYVYALTEGKGVYGSANQGNSWIPPGVSPSLGVSLLMDPAVQTRLYAGRVNAGTQTGGIFRSINSGSTFGLVGLKGVTVSDIALNGNNTRIYVAAYASGIYTSPVP